MLAQGRPGIYQPSPPPFPSLLSPFFRPPWIPGAHAARQPSNITSSNSFLYFARSSIFPGVNFCRVLSLIAVACFHSPGGFPFRRKEKSPASRGTHCFARAKHAAGTEGGREGASTVLERECAIARASIDDRATCRGRRELFKLNYTISSSVSLLYGRTGSLIAFNPGRLNLTVGLADGSS